MWNGILGDMYIVAEDKARIENLQLYPDAASHTVKAIITLQNSSEETKQINLNLQIKGKDDGKHYASAENRHKQPKDLPSLN